MSSITSRRLKTLLLGGIASVAATGIAAAQDTTIGSATTAPVRTSEAGNVTVSSAGTITVDAGPAITLDSNNTVDQGGTITVGEGTNATGVLITGDRTFTYTQGGSISMQDARTPENEVAVDYADDRFGLRLAAGNYTGGITFTNTAAVRLDGDFSRAVSLEGALDGAVSFDGDVALRGTGSTGLAIDGNVTGDVAIGANSTIQAIGVLTDGVNIQGDIGGALTYVGSVTVTGFQDTTPDAISSTATDAERATIEAGNAAQAGLQSGHGFVVGGNVNGGVVLDGGLPAGFTREVSAARASTVTVFGGGNAFRLDGGTTGAIIGLVDHDVVDSDGTVNAETNILECPVDDTTRSASACQTYGNFGLINRGTLSSSGTYSGVAATTFFAQNAIVAGGIRNDGAVDAVAADAEARGMVLGGNLVTPTLNNAGRISARADGTGADAIGLTIGVGATVDTLTNSNRIEAASVSDTDGDAIAILDQSGSITAVSNSGVIQAARRNETIDAEGPVDPRVVAMDFSANLSGIDIYNTVRDGFTSEDDAQRSVFGLVIGDVLTGSGDDRYRADAGITTGNLWLGDGNDTVDLSRGATLFGDINFGAGDDVIIANAANINGDIDFGAGLGTITLTGGSILRGGMTTLGAIDVAITGSSLLIESATTLALGTLNIAADGDTAGVLGIGVAADGSGLTRLNAASVNIADGSEIRTIFSSAFSTFGGSDPNLLESVILSSANMNVNLDTLVLNAEGNSPILFEQALRFSDASNNDVILSLRRKTAEELGIDRTVAAAFDPVIAALTADETLGVALFNTTSEADFREAFDQIVAGPLDAPLAYARAQNSSLTSLISQRIDLLGEREDLTRTAWLQQQSYFVERDAVAGSNGFDGGGFVIAGGIDTPVAGLDVLGVAAHLASSRYDEKLGEDFPFNRLTYGIDVYAAEDFGAIEVDGRIGYAIADSDSERNVAFGGERRLLTGEWEGTQLTANGRVRYRHRIGESQFEAVPFVSFDYISLSEDAYTEAGDDILALDVEEREAESLRGNVGVSLGKVYNLRPSAYDTGIPGTITPRLTVAYSHEFASDDIEATYAFNNGNPFTLLSEPESGAAMIGGDIDYENQYAKVSVGASGAFGDTTNIYTLRIGVGLKW